MGDKIVLFKNITQEEVLSELEEKAKKYDGLYVDMEDKEQRKFVKDKASFISGLLKKIDRARIDMAQDYRLSVESEAGAIRQRLEDANAPFQLLIDKHKAERAKILANEKADAEAEALAKQLPIDHDEALQMNELFDFKVKQAERERLDREEKIRLEAEAKAKADAEVEAKEREDKLAQEKWQAEQDAINAENARKQAEAQAKIDAENAEVKRLTDIENAKQAEINRQEAEKLAIKKDEAKRQADQAHVTNVCKEAKETLMTSAGVDEQTAINVVKAIRSGFVKNVEIKI